MKSNRLGICCTLAMTLCMADSNKPKQPPAENTSAHPKNSQAGSSMIVVKDADGALRVPTAAEAQALTGGAAQRSFASTNQLIDQGTSGGLMLVLDPATSQVYSVAKKGPDGKLKVECVTGENAADKVVRDGIRTRPLKEEISDK